MITRKGEVWCFRPNAFERLCTSATQAELYGVQVLQKVLSLHDKYRQPKEEVSEVEDVDDMGSDDTD